VGAESFVLYPKLPEMAAMCKHPIVKVVAREDDIEFVECQKCGEVFDSAEYSDMALEDAEQMEDASMDD
jgi:Zn ribbon nucleic-acid-binding protein